MNCKFNEQPSVELVWWGHGTPLWYESSPSINSSELIGQRHLLKLVDKFKDNIPTIFPFLVSCEKLGEPTREDGVGGEGGKEGGWREGGGREDGREREDGGREEGRAEAYT